jgi:hypothetical protein
LGHQGGVESVLERKAHPQIRRQTQAAITSAARTFSRLV